MIHSAGLRTVDDGASSRAYIYYEGRVVARGALASVDAREARLAGGHEGLLTGMFVEFEIDGAPPRRRRAVVLESSAEIVRLGLEDGDVSAATADGA